MANMLKKIKAMEHRERNRMRQRYAMVAIGVLFFAAIFYGLLYAYTMNAESERKAITAEGIKALAYSDFYRAEALLKQADAEQDPYAAEFLSYFYVTSGQYDNAALYAEKAVKFKRHTAYEILGDLALIGFGRAKGVDAAISFFEQGAIRRANDEAALIKQGLQVKNNWYNGDPLNMVPRDINLQATEYFSQMVKRALPLLTNEKDYIDFILKTKQKGAKDLEMQMGDMLFVGNDKISSNAQAALEYWKAALDKGIADAYVRLGGVYWHGYAAKRNPQDSIDMYSAAVDKKNPIALYSLGLISLRSGAKGGDEMGIQLFNTAAANGYGPASTALGVFALTETDTPDALTKAGNWIRIAAVEQNDLSGRIIYDLMLMSGIGAGKEFSRGFDDLLEISKVYGPAKSIIDLLQQRIEPADILKQVLVVSNNVLRGNIAYREGDPVAQQEIKDPTTGEVMDRPFSFYESVSTLDKAFKDRYGARNFTSVTDISKLAVNNEPILSPELVKVIVQYSPSTGVAPFVADTKMPRPEPPLSPSDYNMDDFVPPVSLLEVQPLRNKETGQLNKIY